MSKLTDERLQRIEYFRDAARARNLNNLANSIDALLADRREREAEVERLRAEVDHLRGLGRRLSDALHSHDGSLLIEDGPVESQLYNFDAWLGHGESGG